jgi:hypothetical protein
MCKRSCLTAASLLIVTLLLPYGVNAATAYAEGLTHLTTPTPALPPTLP